VNLGAVLVLGVLALKFMEEQATTTTKTGNGRDGYIIPAVGWGDPRLPPELRHL